MAWNALKDVFLKMKDFILNPKKVYESKISERSKVREIDEKLSSMLQFNLYHLHYIVDEELLKVYVYNDINEKTNTTLVNALEHINTSTFKSTKIKS